MVKEGVFATWIEATIHNAGYWYVNVHGSGMSNAGIPDILACVSGKFIGIEVKRSNNSPSVSQCREGINILKAGGRFIVAYEDYEPDFLTGKECAHIEITSGTEDFDLFDLLKTKKGSTYEVVMNNE